MDFIRKMLPGGAERYPEGVEFPIEKQKLTDRLLNNGIPGPVMDPVRQRLPEGRYSGSKDILDHLRR